MEILHAWAQLASHQERSDDPQWRAHKAKHDIRVVMP